MELQLAEDMLWLLEGNTRKDLGKIEPTEIDQFRVWANRYDLAIRRSGLGNRADLRDIGREAFDWLTGRVRAFASETQEGSGPLRLVLGVPPRTPRDFIDVPWELLRDATGFLAADAVRPFLVGRRIGRPNEVLVPRFRDLLILFMAADPYGETSLDYEREEAAILKATSGLNMALVVEEGGTIDDLGERAALETPDVVHLSCHGDLLNGRGVLCLEKTTGELDPVDAGALVTRLGDQRPALTFISACRTAENVATALPIAAELVRAGIANVIGWDGSVSDHDAGEFAEQLYRNLTLGNSVLMAAAKARHTILTAQREGVADVERDWHMARVYLGPTGGGPLLGASLQRRDLRRAGSHQRILDLKRDALRCAKRNLFVGRRRQLQRLRRAFLSEDRRAALIWGVGAQGKTSLAARLSDRLNRHSLALVYERYAALDVFDAVRNALPAKSASEWGGTWREIVERSPLALADALVAALEGPAKIDDAAAGKQPILLLIDDLERILDPKEDFGPERRARVDRKHAAQDDHPYEAILAAVISAFRRAQGTESRLLFTGRFDFGIPDGHGSDLTDGIERIHLPPFNETEQRKLLLAEQRDIGRDREAESEEERERRDELLVEGTNLAQGNPGLQSLLNRQASEDLDLGAVAIVAVRANLKKGELPATAETATFLKRIALDAVFAALDEPSRRTARAACIFQGPVPGATLEAAVGAFDVDKPKESIRRLASLGLLETIESATMPLTQLSALATNLVERDLQATDDQIIAGSRAAARALESEIKNEDGLILPGPLALELTQLAFVAGEFGILDRAARTAVFWLHDVVHDSRSAAGLGKQSIDRLIEGNHDAHPTLFRLTIDALNHLGRGNEVDRLLTLAAGNSHSDARGVALLAITRAERYSRQGRSDDAEIILRREAIPVFDRIGDALSKAISLGKIADILYRRGDYDEALRIRIEEELPVYKSAHDARATAITSGKIADILFQRGDFDEALRIRMEEELPVYERLGDVRAKAIILGDIAQILFQRGNYDEALRIKREHEVPVYEQLSDVRAKAVASGQIADILIQLGDYNEALRIVKTDQLPILERIGDARERAIALGRVAQIFALIGNYDDALRLERERLPIVEELRDSDGIAHVEFNIFQLIMLKDVRTTSESEQAVAGLRKAYEIVNRLGRPDAIAAVGRRLGLFLKANGARREVWVPILENAAAAARKVGRNQQADEIEQSVRDGS